jgi:hypothetical protein
MNEKNQTILSKLCDNWYKIKTAYYHFERTLVCGSESYTINNKGTQKVKDEKMDFEDCFEFQYWISTINRTSLTNWKEET